MKFWYICGFKCKRMEVQNTLIYAVFQTVCDMAVRVQMPSDIIVHVYRLIASSPPTILF